MIHQPAGTDSTVSIAILTLGYYSSGGVSTVARWLYSQAEYSGYDATIIDVDPSSRSDLSRRLVKPSSWIRTPRLLESTGAMNVVQCGTALAELEITRYLPRPALTKYLNQFDLVQVVCGGPAFALIAIFCERPVIVQMATRAHWERQELIARSSGIKRLYHVLMTKIISGVEVPVLRRTSSVLVENSEVLRNLQSAGIKSALKAPPGVDTDHFKPGDSTPGPSGPLLYLGRLGDPRKGIERLLRSYLRAKKTNATLPDLQICGKGDLSSAAQELIRSDPDRGSVHVLTNLSPDQVLLHLRSASIFIQASFEEGLGLALIEAMACGLPAIATQTAGTAESVQNGENGILIPQDEFNADSLSQSVNAILEDHTRYSRAARAYAVENFSNRATFRSYVRTYRSVLG